MRIRVIFRKLFFDLLRKLHVTQCTSCGNLFVLDQKKSFVLLLDGKNVCTHCFRMKNEI